MKKQIKLTESELKKIIEQKVNEAWYNNMDDFYKGVGKAATIGTLGAASLMGGGYALDKGLEQQERYEQQLNKEAEKNMYGSDYHYQQWCQEHNLDPDSQKAEQFYDSWVNDQFNEAKKRLAMKLTESIINGFKK